MRSISIGGIPRTPASRRKFINRQAALIAVGGSATPEQINAFEQLYAVNTEHLDAAHDIVFVDDISFGFGGTPRDAGYVVSFHSDESVLWSVSINHRATMRWCALPQNPMISTVASFWWDTTPHAVDIEGTIRLRDITQRVHIIPLRDPLGQLRDYLTISE